MTCYLQNVDVVCARSRDSQVRQCGNEPVEGVRARSVRRFSREAMGDELATFLCRLTATESGCSSLCDFYAFVHGCLLSVPNPIDGVLECFSL